VLVVRLYREHVHVKGKHAMNVGTNTP